MTDAFNDCPHVSTAYDARDVPYCPNCGAHPHPEAGR